MEAIADATPWYRQAGINLPVLTDSLALNEGIAPARFTETKLFSTLLVSFDWRIRHGLGLLPVWNITTLGDSLEPVQMLQNLVRHERTHSRLLIILLVLCGGALACVVVPGWESGCYTVAILSSGAGLLYHGLVVQPELLGCGLAGVLSLLCVMRGTTTSAMWRHRLWLMLAGLCGGFAALTHDFGTFHLLTAYAWCWLASLPKSAARPGPSETSLTLVPVAGALLLLWLTHHLVIAGALTAVVAERLRVLALLTGLLPLLALWEHTGRLGVFLRARAIEFALLGGGAIAAIVLSYAALRSILPADIALTCWAGQLELLFYPRPWLHYLLTAPTETGREAVSYLKESPFLYASAAGLALIVCLQGEVPARTKAFIGLLAANALGHTWLLASAGYTHSGTVGVQVPLLLLCSIALLATGPWPQREGRHPWLTPILLVAATVLLVTTPLRLRVKVLSAITPESPSVHGTTLTYLFDHYEHPPAYRQMMAKHYTDRAGFLRKLTPCLDQPDTRD